MVGPERRRFELLGGVLNRSNETQDLFVFDDATGQQLLVGTEYFAMGFPRLNSSGSLLAFPMHSSVRVHDVDTNAHSP